MDVTRDSSIGDWLSANGTTILYVVIALVVLYLLWGWYKGYSVNVTYDNTPRDQRMMAGVEQFRGM